MTAENARDALIITAIAGPIITLAAQRLFSFFRPKHEVEKSAAEVKAMEADSDAKIIDAAAKMFTATVEDMRKEISDLRGRLTRVETEVIELRRERDHLIRENEDLRGKLDLAHGEIRQLQQLISSRSRHDSADIEDPTLPPPEGTANAE